MRYEDILSKYTKSSAWQIGGNVALSVIGLVSFLLIARILTPSQIGIAAFGVSVMKLIHLLALPRFSVYLWQNKKNKILESSIFWMSITGCFVVGCILALTVYSLRSFGLDQYSNVSLWIIPIAFIKAVELVPRALLYRHFKQKLIIIIVVISNVFGAIVGVWTAYAGAGEWAIIQKVAVTDLCACLCILIAVRWKPTLQFDTTKAKDCLKFGVSIQANHALEYVQKHGVVFIIAGVWGSTTLGYYNLARKITGQVGNLTLGSVVGVGYPALARLKADFQEALAFVENRTGFHIALFLPCYCVGILWANELVMFVFGEQWGDITSLLVVLLAANVIHLLVHLLPVMLITYRHERLRAVLFAAAYFVHILILVSMLHSGVVWIANAQMLAAIFYAISLLIALKCLFKDFELFSYFTKAMSYSSWLYAIVTLLVILSMMAVTIYWYCVAAVTVILLAIHYLILFNRWLESAGLSLRLLIPIPRK